MMPTEHDVSVSLHQALSLYHTLAVAFEGTGLGVALQDRGGGLLCLQNQRIMLIDAPHQQDPSPGAHAADADDFPRDVDELVLGDQVPAIGGQALAVFGEDFRHPACQVGRCLLIKRQVPGGHNERWLVDEAELLTDRLGHLLEGAEAVAGPSLLEGRSEAPSSRLRLDRAQSWHSGLDGQVCVPDLEIGLAGEVLHRLSIALDGSDDNLTAFFATEFVVSSGDFQASGQALDIPLEGTGVGFVKVVEVEHELSLRRGENPKIAEVSIAADLRGEVRARTFGEIARHDQRRSAVKGEGGDEHASVADGDQLGHAVSRLLFEELDWIAVRGPAVELGVRLQRHLTAHGLASGGALFPGVSGGALFPGGVSGGSGRFRSRRGRLVGSRSSTLFRFRGSCLFRSLGSSPFCSRRRSFSRIHGMPSWCAMLLTTSTARANSPHDGSPEGPLT